MSGWLHYLELQAKSKTGLSCGVAAWALAAVLAAAVTLGFLIFAAFIWLAQRYDPLSAALVLCAFFLLVTIIAVVCCALLHRRTAASARTALAARHQSPWLDPKFLGVGLQVGRSLGWRRLVPLLAVGLLAATLTKEWLGHDRPGVDDDEDVRRDAA